VTGKIGNGTMPFKTAALPKADTPFFRKLDQIIQNSTAENKEDRLETVGQLRSLLLDAIAELEKEHVQKVATKSERFPILQHAGWVWAGIVVAVASIVAMTMWHLIGNPGKTQEIVNRPQIVGEQALEAPKPVSNNNATNRKPPAPTVLTEDGATLHLIPGGTVTLAEASGGLPSRQWTVNPFYMDETQVTNHQYVEFLNHHLSQLEVERGVVRVDDEIWLMLGEIFEGYEPIVFQDGEFKVANAIYTSLPVLRVTAYGAAAYARFYSRRLPTYAEWLYVFDRSDLKQDKPIPDSGAFSNEKDFDAMHNQMHGQPQTEPRNKEIPARALTLVTDFPSDRYGLRGLGRDNQEWVLWFPQPASRNNSIDADYAVLPEAVIRQPWEAFEKVGFRCVRGVNLRPEEKIKK
jgi:formylglycine-generating enzyme required for sulfatase activity